VQDLTDSQLERYARHIVLREVGGPGQQRLLRARVGLIGAGGIGSPAALYLAAAGVGHLRIIDDDRVDLSNLQRQVLHATPDLGRPKTRSAMDRIAALNPDVRTEGVATRLQADNATELLAGLDLVIDGSDSFASRLAVSDACLALGLPLVSAALGPFEGQLAVFRGHEPEQPCYRCFLGAEPPAGSDRSCAEIGMLGAVAGVMGSWAALEAIRELCGIGESLAGRMLLFDARQPGARTIRIPRDPACAGGHG